MESKHARILCLGLSLATLAACGGTGNNPFSSASSSDPMHRELQIVDPSLSGSSQGTGLVSSMSAGTVSAQGLITVGSVYLDGQLPSLTVAGTALQATDVAVYGSDAYVTYSSVDTGGVIIKKGAVQHVSSVSCDNPLTSRVEYCMNANAFLAFPTDDLFAAFADATGLWVAGSSLLEDQAPLYARIYKINMSAAKDPISIATSQALQSYAGTGIVRAGSNLLVTTGTSVTLSMQGGVTAVDANTLAPGVTQNLYDARAVALDPLDSTHAFVVRGALDLTHPGAVEDFPSTLATGPTREIATGGNTIPQSKSSVLVGKTLLLTSMGDQGFRVSCKGTGASLATVPAPVVTGVLPALTVTNSVAALPGYILAANGEAGVYIYKFAKTSALNTSYCQGVTLTLLGRLSLGATDGYVNGELSANSVRYVPTFNLLGALTAKLVVIASGNKGTSLINMSQLNVSLTDVDDF